MAKASNQKLKVLYLKKILEEETDEQHPLTMSELIGKLESFGISADRKSIYADMEELRNFGMDIIAQRNGQQFVYFLGSRDFELAEVKLLADAVASAKFISEKRSKELVKKLGMLTGRAQAKLLNRAITLAGKVKSVNESVYYTVDTIHEAMAEDSKIRFQYYQWNQKKQQQLRHGGAFYNVSPWALVWDDEYYYLLAYDEESGIIKHYRVDKMLKVELTGEKRKGREVFEKIDVASYSKRLFSMFTAQEEKVTIEAENSFAGMLIDRFGTDIFMMPLDQEHFRAVISVAASEQFFSWIFSLGEGIRITGPESVLEKVRKMVRRLDNEYRGDM